MPKFMKQVRNFLNNSPFKMYGTKPAPAKFNASLKKASASGKLNGSPKFKAAVDASSPMTMYKKSAPFKETKSTVSKKFNPKGKLGSEYRRKEYDAENKKYDDTIKGYNRDGSKKNANKPAVVLDPVTVTADRIDNRKPIPKSMTSDIKKPADKKIKKVTKEELAANAKITKNKKIAAKAKAAMDKKKAAAAGQTQDMKDKNKLKAEIKDKRKSTTRKERKKDVKYQDKDTGKNVSAQDQLKAKRKEKRKKGKAIRKYKRDPNNMKVAKVKKEKKSKVNAKTPSGNSGQAFVGEKPKKPAAPKMYKKKK